MTPEEKNRALVFAQCGRTVLWGGNEARNWATADWRNAARFTRSLGVDTLCAKVADGNERWYGNSYQLLHNIRDVVLAEGCGFIPFIYAYGPRFGLGQVDIECATLADMMSVCPLVQCDMEVEWNNQPVAAQRFAAKMAPVPGLLSISTWADPVQQQWLKVAEDLAPATNQWVIQQYTDWLAAQEVEYPPAIFTCIAPGVDLRPEFGTDHPLNIAKLAKQHGHQTLYIWELQSAKANPALVKGLVAIMAS